MQGVLGRGLRVQQNSSYGRIALTFYSYHSSQTLSSMRLYRIGYIVEPWINFTPPIRGGIFRKHPEDEDLIDSDDDLSDASTINASSTASHTPLSSSSESCRRRRDGTSSARSSENKAWSKAFVNKLIKGEVEDDLRDYPSLDAGTQQSINAKFQALHQRVKDDGYYQCHFTEYLKELSRYAILFTCFFVALMTGWCLTSAAFLGLFWVSTHSTQSLSSR